MKSMTAFARRTMEYDGGVLHGELKAVNHRYLDVSIRLPEDYRSLEMPIRQAVAAHVQRGKLEFSLRCVSDATTDWRTLNETKVNQLSAWHSTLSSAFPEVSVSFASLLGWPGVLESPEQLTPESEKLVMSLLSGVLDDFTAQRASEGGRLQQCLQAIIASMREHISVIQSRYPVIIAEMRQRLLSRLDELQAQFNQDRLEQEMVYWSQKCDVGEEIQRFESHMVEIEAMFSQNKPIGRKLDFYLQELNREINTIGSKLQDDVLTPLVVELKVGVEQLREQVQNIE